MPTIEAIVFDLDGLMLNTEDIFRLTGREMLARRGLLMTDEIHHRMLGRRPDEALQVMKDLTGITATIEELRNETAQLFEAIAADRLEMMPGVSDLLDLIEGLGLPKAVATSSPRDYVDEMLGRFNLGHRFSFALTAEDVTHGKPHPEIYLTAAGRLSVEPSRMLVFEDSETGTRAAAAAGAVTVSVPNRHTERGDFGMAWMRVNSLAAPEVSSLLRGDER